MVVKASGHHFAEPLLLTADLAENTLQRLTRVLGGGTFSQRSPFSHWFEDARGTGLPPTTVGTRVRRPVRHVV
jgi:hypothetical protein